MVAVLSIVAKILSYLLVFCAGFVLCAIVSVNTVNEERARANAARNTDPYTNYQKTKEVPLDELNGNKPDPRREAVERV